MGNYVDFEQDFIARTMLLIEQYNKEIVPSKPFHEQFNYTLLVNCLFGLIVMPKERVISAIPNDRLTSNLKIKMGINVSQLPDSSFTLRDLITKLRNSIAHCDFEVISLDENSKFDSIVFRDNTSKEVFADFSSSEILPFLHFYTDLLNGQLENLKTIRE